jgi:hypothetical protein
LQLRSNSGHHPTPLFWYLGFHGNAILNFIDTPKASTHYGEYETLQEYHMPCEVVPLRVDFFQNGCRCHGTAKMLKK